ncbi:MAG: DPP IV N-terminal domain-containing protein [Gemmatimonadota bacterium]|nr:DPP IV N-terminal domain-containing protein [Gemmatimonadota bacterium]
MRSRHRTPRPALVLAAAVTLGSTANLASAQQMDVTRYHRAERLLAWNVDPLISGGPVSPTWMAGGNRFWYRNQTASGAEFVVADPDQRSRTLLFDHDRLAAAMSLAADTAFDGSKLPFRTFEFGEGDGLAVDEGTIRFNANKRGFTCDIRAYDCVTGDTLVSRVPFVRSPDGRTEAFVHEHNLWIRPFEGGDSTQLTTDGEEFWSYGTAAPRPSQIIASIPARPVLQWSPDSRRIAVQRMDERDVERMPIISSTSQRPKLYTYPYGLPGDSIIATFDIHVVDVEGGRNLKLQTDPQPYMTFTATGMRDSTWVTVKWKEGGERFYFVRGSRGGKSVTLYEADLETGAARTIIEETRATHVELNLDLIGGYPNWDVINSGDDVIWFSERDGWGHLYRFDGDGELRNRITEGAWTFGDILDIDEATGRIVFTARGREPGRIPTMADLYTVNLDGSGLTHLGGEDADHTVRASPDGRYFVDSWSRPDVPPVSVVRDRNGRVVLELETADVSRLEEVGWSPPEVFEYKARDGVTSMYGLLYKPSDFDPEKVYPVVEYIYPGPFIGSVGRWNFTGGLLGSALRGDQDALAELGFIVVQMDHLGTPYRSKAIQDNYWGNMGDNGIPDHIAGVKQLGARHPWIDLERVGIYGHSGGGFASTDAILRYPDFYKVAVSTAGNHDNRSYHAAYAEKYQGLLVRDTIKGTDNYANQVNASLAGNLKGKLFLMTGDMDDNVHPAMTLQVANALIAANKTFDFLILPDRAHGLSEPYVIRRRWDYFVEHLMGLDPPPDYQIQPPPS